MPHWLNPSLYLASEMRGLLRADLVLLVVTLAQARRPTSHLVTQAPSEWGNGPWDTGLDETRADFTNSNYQSYPDMDSAEFKREATPGVTASATSVADPCNAGSNKRCLRVTGRWLRGGSVSALYIKFKVGTGGVKSRFQYAFATTSSALSSTSSDYEDIENLPDTLPGESPILIPSATYAGAPAYAHTPLDTFSGLTIEWLRTSDWLDGTYVKIPMSTPGSTQAVQECEGWRCTTTHIAPLQDHVRETTQLDTNYIRLRQAWEGKPGAARELEVDSTTHSQFKVKWLKPQRTYPTSPGQAPAVVDDDISQQVVVSINLNDPADTNYTLVEGKGAVEFTQGDLLQCQRYKVYVITIRGGESTESQPVIAYTKEKRRRRVDPEDPYWRQQQRRFDEAGISSNDFERDTNDEKYFKSMTDHGAIHEDADMDCVSPLYGTQVFLGVHPSDNTDATRILKSFRQFQSVCGSAPEGRIC